MFDPFVGLSDLAPQQLKFRARVIQAHLDRWSLDELLRGRHFGEPPHPGVQGPRRGGYDPNQPRVPVGHPDGGQWTDDERRADNDPRAGIRFAANERLPIGRRGKFAIALEIARRLIEAFRVDNAWDLFGRQEEGIVAVVTINGKDIYGTNSEFGDWQAIDHAEARRLRANIVRRYPYSAGGPTLGQMRPIFSSILD